MRAIKFYSLIFIFPVLFFFSCKKDDIQSQAGTPIFYAKGNLNGNPFAINAGVENYYMYSSYFSDALDIYQYTGNLKEQNCSSGCAQSMAVHIRDYRAHTSSATDVDSSFAPGSYNFVLPSTSLTETFTSQLTSFDSVTSYSWNFGDANTSGLPNPVHTYAAVGDYEVCLSVTGAHNSHVSSSSICDSIHVGATPIVNPSFTSVQVSAGDSLLFTGSATGGTSPYSYYWLFGDFSYSNVSPIIHQYPNPGVYACELLVTDANNITEGYKRNICTPLADSSVANFIWQQTPSAFDFSKVIIEWTDASGNVYTSENSQQPVSSTFQIVSVENFQANENQQATKKIHMNVNCVLFNGTNTLLLQNADIVFAVAYP